MHGHALPLRAVYKMWFKSKIPAADAVRREPEEEGVSLRSGHLINSLAATCYTSARRSAIPARHLLKSTIFT